MGARAGWRWISVVVMGRFPVRLSLRAASYVLQDKRRRVRIIRRRARYVRYSVVGVSLSIWLDRRSRLSGKFMSTRMRASFTKCHRPISPRTAGTRLRKQRTRISLSIYICTKAFSFLFIYFFFSMFFEQLVVIYVTYASDTVPLQVNRTDRLS